MAEDIHKIWKLWGMGGLIEKIGPHRTIRELKKRGEAGAVIGWTLYKLLIEKWMDVAMTQVDPGARGPAYEFMEVAGEGELIPRIEALHEKYPPKLSLIKDKETLVTGIPVNVRFDLKDEWNAALEQKVGRRIPLDPRDASPKDIAESKKIAEQLAAGVGLPRPAKPKVGVEELPPPPPVKPVERAPPRAAPELVPTPIITRALPELDLMKKEIKERIEEEKRRRLKRGPIAGESSDEYLMKGAGKKTSMYSGWTYDAFKAIINRTTDIEALMDLAKHIEESSVMTPGDKVSARQLAEKRKRDIVSGTPELRKQIEEQQREGQLATASKLRDDDKKNQADRIRENEGGVAKSFTEFVKWVEKVKDMGDPDQLKKLYNEVDTISALSSYDKLQLQKFIMTRMQDILELQEKGKPIFPEQFREDAGHPDQLSSPDDYAQWTFGDFESILPGIEDVEDMEEIRDYIDLADKIPDSEKEILRNMISARIKELSGLSGG